MNRRQYLARTGTAGASVGFLTGLAGCLDDLGGAGDTTDDTTDADDGAADSRAGVRALDRAAGDLNTAALALDELDDLEDPSAVEFDPSEPRARLADGRDHLETAAAELGDDRAADIDTLRSYADALEGLVAVTVTVTDEGLSKDVDTVTTALETERGIEEASTTVGDRHADIAAAGERLAEVDATIQGIDADRLDALADVPRTDLEEGATALDEVVTPLETLAAAYDTTLGDAGYGALDRGRDHLDEAAYEDARDEFSTAESTVSDAHQRLENGTADAPDGLVGHFETATCQTGHLTDAAAAFADAATASAERDPAASDHRSEAEAALDRIGDCSD
ncbi:hypothetical protein [Natrinema gari]|uniref:Uncharacterized protein n=1 Tax=Natrinema gari JCM 14663 TaxID=1230459 RepID=L9YXB6_9EURY|nr:hypothetical protein [Natrinema gari]ELY78870.1 hypothetical protein C486_12568 [Natrinema gari JCM 14663]